MFPLSLSMSSQPIGTDCDKSIDTISDTKPLSFKSLAENFSQNLNLFSLNYNQNFLKDQSIFLDFIMKNKIYIFGIQDADQIKIPAHLLDYYKIFVYED